MAGHRHFSAHLAYTSPDGSVMFHVLPDIVYAHVGIGRGGEAAGKRRATPDVPVQLPPSAGDRYAGSQEWSPVRKRRNE
jgi:hypothetical protein